MPVLHNRKLGLSGVALTKLRNNKNDIKALTLVRDELEPILDKTGYLADAPFSWVTVVVRYGLIDKTEPTYQAINRKFGDLPLAIEVDASKLTGLETDALSKIFRKAVVIALLHAGKKYGRPIQGLESIVSSQ